MLGMGDLFRQAWDATKLGLAIRAYRGEKALVAAEKNQVRRYTPKQAIEKMRELYEERQYEEMTRLFLPDIVVDKAIDFVEFWWTVWDIYWLFVLLRIVFVFLPLNSGYIHPDEYFQSLEVTYGDVLDIETQRTWEFNSTQPLRSQTLPYCLYGIPLSVLKNWDKVIFYNFGFHFLGPWLLHLVPKLILLTLSFSIDFTVYKICKLYKHSFNQCLTTLASSYVMLVYATRTFSNTLELLFSTFLLYFVAYSMKRSDETVYLQELVQNKYSKAESVREKVEIQKKKKLIPPHDFKHVLPIGIICAFGVFNRPTFVFFAFSPLFFWFQRGIANYSMFTPFQIFNFRMLALLPIFVVTSLIIILGDSLYFGELTLTNLWHLTLKWKDWKVAPYNFIMYNAVPGNLASHGVHPRYTHTLVNLPMLFGPLAPVFLLTTVSWLVDVCHLSWRQKPGVRTVYALTLFSALVPLAALSLVKHQEARFLVPILPCLVLMCSHKLRWKCFGYRPLLTLWYAFNILATVWFGFIHQAGVIPVQKYIAGINQNSTPYVNLVYSYTYMPPRFPLMQPRAMEKQEQQQHKGEEGLVWEPPYILNPTTKYIVQDLGSAELNDLHARVVDLVSRSDYIYRKQGKAIRTYLILPTFLLRRLETISRGSLWYEELHVSGPHVSVESLALLDPEVWDSDGAVSPVSLVLGSIHALQGLSLSLYNVTLGDVATVDMPRVLS